jgi:hypothetical protein
MQNALRNKKILIFSNNYLTGTSIVVDGGARLV